MATSSDIVTLNVGGRRFTTTLLTLESSGAAYFQSLLLRWTPSSRSNSDKSTAPQVTPSNKNPRKRSRDEDDESENLKSRPSELFVDADPDGFQDVLYFMRRQTLNPSILANPCALVKLKTEGEFFAYDALIQACQDQLKSLKQKVKASIQEQSARQKVKSGTVLVDTDDLERLVVPKGKVLYISHAVLGGRAHVQRYNKSDDKDKNIPGCYLNTSEKDDSGDFALCCEVVGTGVQHIHDLAHVGKDHIHCGDRPIDMDFNVPVHKCFFAADDKDLLVCLRSEGSGDWSVHYYIGYPDRIPFLGLPATNGSSILASPWTNSFKREQGSQEDKEDGDNATDDETHLELAALVTAMVAALF